MQEDVLTLGVLHHLAVQPHLRGSGLGRRLLEFAEARAQALGFAAIELYTHESMVENIALYQRIGYVETARRRVKTFDRVYMQKPLPQPSGGG